MKRHNYKMIIVAIVSIVLVLCLLAGGAIIWQSAFRKISQTDSELESVKYENGDYYYKPQLDNVSFDEKSNLLYYNNLIKVYLLNDIDSKTEKVIVDSVGGEIVGRTKGASNTLQIKVNKTDLPTLENYTDKVAKNENVLYACYEMPTLNKCNADNNPWKVDSKDSLKNDWWAQAIDAYYAWDNTDLIKKPITIGIADDGIDENHEDFIVDGNSKVRVLDDGVSTPEDHATHVAGIIGAADNTIGIRGIADKSSVLSVDVILSQDIFGTQKQLYESGARVINNSWGNKVFSEDAFNKKEIVNPVDSSGNKYIPTHSDGREYDSIEIQVLELFTKYYSGAYDQYINYQKTLCQRTAMESICFLTQLELDGDHDFMIVKAAGNGYVNENEVEINQGHNSFYSGYFSSVNEETYNMFGEDTREKMKSHGITYKKIKSHILNVGAVQQNQTKGKWKLTKFSNYGETVDIVAPGENILSCVTLRDDSTTNNDYKGKSYAAMDGTSMAAPMVSGAVAFLWSMIPELNSSEIKEIVLKTSEVAEGFDTKSDTMQYKMLNIGKAVKSIKKAVPELSQKPTEPPIESQLEDWKRLYIDLVNESEQYSDFALIQVTGGNIPNLLYTDNSTNSRKFALVFEEYEPNVTLQLQVTDIGECGLFPSDDIFLYQEQGLSFCYSAYTNKNAKERVYQIGGKPVILFDGSYVDGFDFQVNGTVVEQATYQTMLKRSFDFDTAKRVSKYKGKDEIISEIRNY